MNELIQLRQVTLLREEKVVLNQVDMQLCAGERLAIVGRNGVGKTTLLRILVGLERPSGGDVVLFGQACTQEAQFRAQRARIGFLFQDSDDQLFCPSVIEDVAFGPCNQGLDNDAARARAAETLAHLGIEHLAERFVHKLSGGEKRLVCLAGLLAMQPDVLLLDEPTNGVDAENGARLRAALHDFPGAILLVSHDAAFVTTMATRAMMLTPEGLVDADIHQHRHVHEHAHLHPRPLKPRLDA